MIITKDILFYILHLFHLNHANDLKKLLTIKKPIKLYKAL